MAKANAVAAELEDEAILHKLAGSRSGVRVVQETEEHPHSDFARLPGVRWESPLAA